MGGGALKTYCSEIRNRTEQNPHVLVEGVSCSLYERHRGKMPAALPSTEARMFQYEKEMPVLKGTSVITGDKTRLQNTYLPKRCFNRGSSGGNAGLKNGGGA